MNLESFIPGLLIYFLIVVFTFKKRVKLNRNMGTSLIVILGETFYWSIIFILLFGIFCGFFGWIFYGIGSFLLVLVDFVFAPIQLLSSFLFSSL